MTLDLSHFKEEIILPGQTEASVLPRPKVVRWETVSLAIDTHKGKNDALIRTLVDGALENDLWCWFEGELQEYYKEKDRIELENQEASPTIDNDGTVIPYVQQTLPTEPIVPTRQSGDVDEWMLANWEKLRQAAYASKEEQLAMLYDDQVNGTTTFKDHNASVKTQYPKPI
jgi:hypothetical protein